MAGVDIVAQLPQLEALCERLYNSQVLRRPRPRPHRPMHMPSCGAAPASAVCTRDSL
jgi:hypothetical protein